MRTSKEFLARIDPYLSRCDYIYNSRVGAIAWHYSTGENVELLFIEAAVRRQGMGTLLLRMMCLEMLRVGKQPYHSVFAYRLKSRTEAGLFYTALGFKEVDLGQSIYAGDGTMLHWIEWENLLKRLGISPTG